MFNSALAEQAIRELPFVTEAAHGQIDFWTGVGGYRPR